MKHLSSAVAISAAFCLSMIGVLTPSIAHADGIGGAACQPGQGVTVAVSYAMDGSDVDVRCAPGTYITITDAFRAAGFEVDDSAGYVTSVGGVDPTVQFGASGWWMLFTSTVDGTPAGTLSADWVMANVGANSGPATPDQSYLFEVSNSWACMFDNSCQPSITLGDLGLGNSVVAVPAQSNLATPDAAEAARWIATQLAANGNVMKTNGTTDWGMTIDAIFALASSGVGGDQLAATAAKLYASGEAYIGAGDGVLSNWSSIAKMILGLEVAELDPAVFPTANGPRNLIDDLRSAMQADGSFGDPGDPFGDNVFSHPLAVLALARTSGGVPPQAVDWLLGQQCSIDTSANFGSYGWADDCSAPDTDSTAMVIQALAAAGVDVNSSGIGLANQWLASQQEASGGFSSSFGGANTNSTGLAAQALGGESSVTTSARQFIGGAQITCGTVSSHPRSLSNGDIGAIAYNQDGFAAAVKDGVKPGLAQTTYATLQAVLGLGGPDFGSLTAQGMQAGLPALTCQGGGASRNVDTGGAPAGSAGLIGLVAGGLLLAGLLVWRRSLALR